MGALERGLEAVLLKDGFVVFEDFRYLTERFAAVHYKEIGEIAGIRGPAGLKCRGKKDQWLRRLGKLTNRNKQINETS